MNDPKKTDTEATTETPAEPAKPDATAELGEEALEKVAGGMSFSDVFGGPDGKTFGTDSTSNSGNLPPRAWAVPPSSQLLR